MSAMFTLSQALAWIPGGRLVGDGNVAVDRVHSDTRTLRAGDLFVALRGERFDANDFLADAMARGAVAAIANRGRLPAGLPGIEVDDTKLALGSLAAGWRAQFTLPLIAVTGSNGKTTVTQMIAAILRAWQPAAMLATEGNLNNDIGLPLQLLRLRAEHRIAVLELGMNHPGEIGYLAAIARPTVALVNNAQREHQEFMATVEAVARENGSVFAALATHGAAVFPAGEPFTALWRQLAGARPCITFGAARGSGPDAADIVLAGTEWQQGLWQVSVQTPAGPLAYRLHIAGRHNVRNSLAAVGCALAAGVPLASIAAGLEAFEPVKGRSRTLALNFGGRTDHARGRHLQRQPGLRARRHRRAGRAARSAPAGAGRHGRGRRPGAAVPRRDGRARAPAPHRALRHARRAVHRDEGPPFHQHRGAQRRGAGRTAGRGQRAGQGLALHEDGAGGRGDHGLSCQHSNPRIPAMLLSLSQWLRSISPEFGFLRVFEYITFRAVMAAMTSLLIGLIAGPWVINRLAAPQDRPAGARLRDGKPPDQERHAHDGRRADPDLDRRLDAAVVRHHQPVRVDRAGRHARASARSAGWTTGARS